MNAWCIVLDHLDGYPGVIGPFATEEEAIRAGTLIWELSGDVGCTVVPLYSAPNLGTEPQDHVDSLP